MCPVRADCTTNQRGRFVDRSLYQDDLDRAAALRETRRYEKAMRKRQVWVEPLFGEGKQLHGLARFRLRRLWRVNIEALLIASGQNIKRLLEPHYPGQRPEPAPAMAASRPLFLFLSYVFDWLVLLPHRSAPCKILFQQAVSICEVKLGGLQMTQKGKGVNQASRWVRGLRHIAMKKSRQINPKLTL